MGEKGERNGRMITWQGSRTVATRPNGMRRAIRGWEAKTGEVLSSAERFARARDGVGSSGRLRRIGFAGGNPPKTTRMPARQSSQGEER